MLAAGISFGCVLFAASLAGVGWFLKWLFTSITTLTLMINLLQGRFEEHEKHHRHRVVEVGSSIDMDNEAEDDTP